MTTPLFLDSTSYPYAYTELYGLADVETGGVGLISSVRSMVVGTSLNWTEPSTALFKTPVDSAGRFLDVLITRISSTVIEWRVRNAAATTVCTRRIQLGTGGLRIYGSSQGLMVEFVQTSQNGNHQASAHLLEMLPDTTSDHTLYVIGNGYFTTAGSADGNGTNVGQYFAIDNGSAGANNRVKQWMDQAGANRVFRSPAARYWFRDAYININFSGTIKWAGRIPHMLLCDSSFNGGDERKIYIDSSTYVTFKTIGLTAVDSMRCMMRKS